MALSNSKVRTALAGVLAATLLSISSTTASAAMRESATSQRLHADVEQALQTNGLTGAVWALVSDDNVTVDAAGLSNAHTRTKLSAQHRVHTGSIAKTLLATGALRLITQRRLTLDAPVTQFLPQLEFDNPWAATHPVRVRHLLDHTSGLDDARLWQVFSLQPQADTPLATAFTSGAGLLRVRSQPGSRFSYSNMGYGLLGMVIEAVTGERYETYMNERLLRPFAMRDSTFSFTSQAGPDADPRLAMGHFENGTTQAAVPTYLRPATQFTTTASDMALLGRFLMGDGRIDDEPFIEPALLQAMGQPLGTEAADAGLEAGYALGLARRDRHAVIGRCHGGSGVGFRAMFCLFPPQQRAFFIAINADSETADYERFNALLIDALDLPRVTPAAPGAAPPDPADWDGLYVAAPNRFASFAWIDTVFNPVSVSWRGEHLRLRSLQSADKLLEPQGNLLFRSLDRASASHVLLRSSAGGRILSDGQQSFERTSAVKIFLLRASLCLGVLGLVYILCCGVTRLFRRRLSWSHAAFAPFASVVMVLFSLPLFFRQSFLELGDLTLASATLAATTTLLPLGMAIGLIQHSRSHASGTAARLDALAAGAVLQLMIVLAAWGLVPLRLWS